MKFHRLQGMLSLETRFDKRPTGATLIGVFRFGDLPHDPTNQVHKNSQESTDG